MASQGQNKNHVISRGWVPKSGLIVSGFLIWLVLSCGLISYAYFETRSEIIHSAIARVLNNSYPLDSLGAVQDIYQTVCKSQNTLDECSIQSFQHGVLVNSVPTVIGPHWVRIDGSFALLENFNPALEIQLRFNPSRRFILTSLAASLFVLLFVITGMAFFYTRWQKNAQERELELRKAQARIGELASQVAHDIRSPLTALNMVLKAADSLPEDHRLIIRGVVQRINNIANTLLREAKATVVNERTGGNTAAEPVMILPLLEAALGEKRISTKDRPNLRFHIDFDQGYGQFVAFNETEFLRVVSNLMNNAIDAISSEGDITLSVRDVGAEILILVRDNGKGIPNQFLSKLGERGFSHGKEKSGEGFGFGLHHARETVQGIGGRLEIESIEHQGTVVTLRLPKSLIPAWFPSKIALVPNTIVVSVDDDESVHSIWENRLLLLGNIFAHKKLRSPVELRSYLAANGSGKSLFFVDYEFIGSFESGLDLIKELNLSSQSILVTSRHDDPALLKKAQALGVMVLAKSLVSIVPLTIEDV
jgi:signal transduction histidine kinase